MKTFVFIFLFTVISILNFNCSDNSISYDVNQTGFIGQVNAINTGGPMIIGSTEYKSKCTIALLNKSLQKLSEFNSDSDGKFKISVEPGIYSLQVLSPKLSDPTSSFTVIKNNFTQVVAVYDMKLR
jgi:hypothetical protein